MTIIVMGYLRTAKGHVDKLEPAIITLMTEAQAMPGCEYFCLSRSIDDPDKLVICARWTSAEANAAYERSDQMAAFTRAVGGVQIQELSVKAWQGHYWRSLLGE